MTKIDTTEGLEFELIDLKEVDLDFLNEEHSPSTGNYDLPKTKAWSKKIAGLDGFIFVTAEYNNGIPAPLKNALDSVYNEWDRKPVAFVGYGTYGAVRAMEHLVNVTAKLGMVPLSKTAVGILAPWESVTKDGVKEGFVHGSLEALLENLQWWTDVLKNAR
jgi:NAD(P)H-dependent FMN reductase